MNLSPKFLFVLMAFLAFSCSDSNNTSSTVEDTSESREQTSDKSDEPPSVMLEIGQGIAMSTQAALGRNLMKAINENGTEYAISFCSSQAIPLTDSVSVALNANIRRVSDKTRNPSNAGSTAELDYIVATKRALSQKKEVKAQMITIGDKHVGYYPILTNQMCMQCHGQPETEVLPGTMLSLKSLYPKDHATGYGTNELRGIWVVEIDKE